MAGMGESRKFRGQLAWGTQQQTTQSLSQMKREVNASTQGGSPTSTCMSWHVHACTHTQETHTQRPNK